MSPAIVRRRHVLILQVALVVLVTTLVAIAPRTAQAAFPGANGWITFERDSDIWVVPADGSAAPTNLPLDGLWKEADPVFSPDGTQIAFAQSNLDEDSNIWVADFDPSGPSLSSPRQVTNGGTDGEPSWSPDGSQIVFEREDDNLDIALWTATIGPSPVVGDRLSADEPLGYSDRNPVWSPIGDKIAFETTINGNSDIYTMNTSGGSLVNLTGSTAFDDHAHRPAWSPDGSRIAFHSNELDTNPINANIWVVNSTDGSNPVNVTEAHTGTDDDRDAAFSPDGTRIVFTRQALGAPSSSLTTVNADGSGAVFEVTTPAETILDNEPDWQPVLRGVNDAYAVDEGGTLAVSAPGVLANDALLTTLIDNPTAVKVSDPSHGLLTLSENGSFTYVHNGSETTSDSFTYRPVQGDVSGSIATVSITVNPVNDAPVAVGDGPFAVGLPGGSFTLPAPGVLGNDTDAEGGALTAVKVSDPLHGSVTLNANGSFTYTHDGSATTSDSFTYQAKDGAGALSNIGTVSLTVAGPPVIPPVIPPVVPPVIPPVDPPVDPPVAHLTGLVDPSQGLWFLYDDKGVSGKPFFFGNPGDFPIFGDWDGDGIETPGMYRQSDGYVYLRNSNTQGAGEIRFFFGNPGDVPIAGDFDGDGFDTVSIYRPSDQTFYIINELGSDEGGLGAAEFSYVFGDPGDKPFVGDFDGDGVETVGLHRESTGLVYFRNSHSQGNADAEFIFGNPGDRLIAGDWTGDGTYSPALFRPGTRTMFFRHTNTAGNADNQFIPVPAGTTWLPIAGRMN